MKRSDIGGLVAALGMVLLALGQTGGANFSTGSPFGTYLGLSSTLSTRLSVLGFGLLVGVAVVGTVLHEVESDQ
jgi:hypothetical protein